MCLISCNTFQKHLLSQKEILIFWPQKWIFEISEAIFDSFWHPNMRKRHGEATLKVSKKNLRPSIKNRLDTFVPNVLGINLIPFSWSYDQNWLRETLKIEKKAKNLAKWAFWNNRFLMLTKIILIRKLSLRATKSIYEAKTQVGLDERGQEGEKRVFFYIWTILKRPNGFWKLSKQLEIAETFLYKIRKCGQLLLTFRQQKMSL